MPSDGTGEPRLETDPFDNTELFSDSLCRRDVSINGRTETGFTHDLDGHWWTVAGTCDHGC